MFTCWCFLCSSFCMVTVLAHSIRIVLLIFVSALRNRSSVLFITILLMKLLYYLAIVLITGAFNRWKIFFFIFTMDLLLLMCDWFIRWEVRFIIYNGLHFLNLFEVEYQGMLFGKKWLVTHLHFFCWLTYVIVSIFWNKRVFSLRRIKWQKKIRIHYVSIFVFHVLVKSQNVRRIWKVERRWFNI